MSKCIKCANEILTGDIHWEMGLCNNCYNELYKVADLEAKLAESEKLKDDAFYNYAWLNQELSDIKQKLKDNEDAYKILCCNHQNLGKAYNELEQQLAEKEQENERLNLEFETQEDWQEKWQKLYDETCNLTQDKISFAVEQLEKVKKDIDCYMAIREGDLPSNIECLLLDFADKIDNQIKQLKEKK